MSTNKQYDLQLLHEGFHSTGHTLELPVSKILVRTLGIKGAHHLQSRYNLKPLPTQPTLSLLLTNSPFFHWKI